MHVNLVKKSFPNLRHVVVIGATTACLLLTSTVPSMSQTNSQVELQDSTDSTNITDTKEELNNTFLQNVPSVELETTESGATSVGRRQQRSFSCSEGGYIGTMLVTFRKSTSSQSAYIEDVSYKIDKTDNNGGDEANVGFLDNGVVPRKELYTDRGIQDNKYHSLGGKYSRGTSGGNLVTAIFIFDKSYWPDPSCSVSGRLY